MPFAIKTPNPTPFRRPFLRAPSAALFVLALSLAARSLAAPSGEGAHAGEGAGPPARERLLMDANWRFAFGHPSDPSKDFEYGTGYFSYFAKAGYGDGPAALKFDDAAWRRLDLPHDWAIEAPFAATASSSHGFKAVGRGFPDRTIGWYRRRFFIPSSDLGRRIRVEFDGVFRDSIVWVNGFYLGRHASGYTGFSYDLTDYLNYGADNVVTVRADASVEEGWFYEGAGIYRHVWLSKTAPLHVAPWGTFVTTSLQEDAAQVRVLATVANDGQTDAPFDLEQTVEDSAGRVLATATVPAAALAAGSSVAVPCVLAVPHPRLWSPETPTLHRLVTLVRSKGVVVDRYETMFGIRTVGFDPDHGFFLNGKRTELKGTNNHQDYLGVGIAVPDSLHEERILRLKEMGGNAFRCAHNPPAPEFLDACDRLGLLVIDENRMMGTSAEALGQLESMITRDRNHPSVILWSIGNEEWAIEGNIKGARVAATVQESARTLDPSRRVTAAISGGWGGISSVIDVVGYNYIKQSNSDKQHADFPLQPGVGTEESTTRQTRGIYFDDPARGHIAPAKNAPSGGNMELGWQYYAARPYLAGLFFWTGLDYRGEPEPYGWPQVASQSGILDLCGNPKDSYYYLKAWWTDRPLVHLFPHWNWTGREGEAIDVWCYSNCEQVELLLNGRSLGAKDMPLNGHLEWPVPYRAGVLEARGSRGGRVLATDRVETTGAPGRLQLAPNRTTIRAAGQDAAVFTVSALDGQGRLVPTADNRVTFTVGGGRLLGMGNGDPSSHDPEVFVDAVRQIAVEDWRGRIAPAGLDTPGPADGLKPLPALGNWKAPRPAAGEVYELSASFSLEKVDPGDRWRLTVPALGIRTSLWLNGRMLARDQDTSANGPAFSLDASQLLAGVNRIQLIVEPYADGVSHMPELTRLGAVQVVTPAPRWQRRLFNGLAQVVVLGGADADRLRLEAESENLAPAHAEVTLSPAASAASVP
jgi:beta-galactosidase